MAVISPTITTSSTPGIEITTSVPNLSYQGLINTLGAICFDIEKMFYGSQMMSQFSNPVTYNKFNIYGNAKAIIISTPISPSQYQSTLYVKLKERGVVFDAESNISFLLVAGNSIQFIFYAKTINVNNALNRNPGDLDNFMSVERAMGKAGFFDAVSEEADQADIVFIPETEGEKKALILAGIPIAKTIPTQSFILNITNHTSGNIPIVLMQQGSPMTSIINATTRYQWDITGVAFTNPVTLQYRTTGNTGAYFIATTALQAASSAGLVSALNALGIGIFWIETSGLSTYVVTWNNNVQYGDLTLGAAYVPILIYDIVQTSITLTQIAFTTTGTLNGYVDWGDGNVTPFSNSGVFQVDHTYAVIGNYTARVFSSSSPLFVQKLGSGPMIRQVTGLSNLTAMTNLALPTNKLITLDISSNPALLTVTINNNNLPTSVINAALIALDGFGLLAGFFDSTGQTPAAPPTGAGAAAKISLQGKGWTVNTD